ncbi:GNAT family N-acetyltransferase [Saccharopolyspora erythraea]|uniref:GNAT family N-acetyltransferase n=1 Tax=Saccharopolyspora erythraea TaxID=1836 RepID=UPI001BACDB08|nr:GNAT family N-acetyltransferase [Saccharopolyspora erythraea]QUH02935.1 GNAT family N-acetyltransferase [Saccharopolyspora erythraea]
MQTAKPITLPPEGLGDGVITVRPLADRDAEAFARGTADEAVRRFGHLPLAAYTADIVREQIRGVIAEGLRSGELAVLAIADATDDRFLGSITLFGIHGHSAEVGFWLAPAARGLGATSRAVQLLAEWSHGHGIRELTARTELANHASQRVLERCGFGLDGGPTEQRAPDGAVFTGLTYRRATRPA